MLIGGRKGHVASFDWNNGRLLSELQLKETVRDVTWLHNESMFAVAQKQYVYIYDKSGMEIHCLKKQNEVYALDYLPYHFLLTSIGRQGILRYQDTSTGILIGEYRTGMGVCQVMKQNPQNAIMHLGHNNGTVSLWSPNSKDPLVKMLCHKGNVLDLAVDLSGRHMVTSGMDGLLKVWDMRNYKEMHSYYTPRPASSVDISQKGMLAASFNSTVNIWKDIRKEQTDGSYMSHLSPANQIHQVKFVPFEDILSFGGDKGINNVIVPGKLIVVIIM
jgi:U3 small nucleolar RNA-associated protein 7